MKSGQPDQHSQVLDAIFKEHYVPLCNYAFHYLKDSDKAANIVVDLLTKISTQKKLRKKYINHPNPKGFLYLSIRNNCLSELRKNNGKTYTYSIDDEPGMFLFNKAAFSTWANNEYVTEIQEFIYQEITKLPPQQKRIMTLVLDEGLSEKEIAAQTGYSPQVIRNYKNRAINKVRKALIRKGLLVTILFYCLFTRN